LPNDNGSVITIDNELVNRRIRFAFVMNQMQIPTYESVGVNTTGYGFLTNVPVVQDPLGYFESPWEWSLTMRLYGIE
jgi:hypothetical protein